jgi:hypothetical protein
MPGPASHLIIMDLEIQRAFADPSTFGGPVLDALTNHKREAALGSIGPDMIFWADWGEYSPVVNAVFDIYQTIDEVYDKLAAIWAPVGDAIDKVTNSLTGGLVSEIQETVALVEGIIQSAIIRLITEQVDLLGMFLKPDLQTKGSASRVPDWNWLDFTHHRRTGRMARALIARAHQSNDPVQRAYACGWLSHVTADVVGHAYVNTAVGGPYRSHWQRHFIQEKFMDTWVWGFYRSGATMPSSVQPNEIPFDYAAWPNVNAASLHELINLGDDLPMSLQNLIVQGLTDAYLQVPHPNVKGTIPFLQAEHINRAYQMLLQALELMTGKDRNLPRPEPPSVFNDDAPPGFPVPGGGSGSGSGGSSGGSFSLLSLLQAILDFIKDLFEYVHDLVLWLISQVTTPLTYPVRYALYLLQLALYEIYRQYRWALCLSGYAFPDPDQLFNPLAQQFINPSANVQSMPRREWPEEQENCLFFPAACSTPQPPGCIEPPAVTSGPYFRWPLNYPFWFIEGEPTNLDMEKALAEADSPAATLRLGRRLFPFPAGVPYRGSLGSAMDFFLRRAREVAHGGGGESQLVLPDWNLDADRGYAFKCWEAIDSNGAATALEPPPATGVSIQYL